MDDQLFIDKLQKLVKAPSGRTKSAVFRDRFPYIEAALAAGISRRTILKEFNETTPLTLTLKTFSCYISRTRKSSKGQRTPAFTTTVGQLKSSGNTHFSAQPRAVAPITALPVSINPLEAKTPTGDDHQVIRNEPRTFGPSDPSALDRIITTVPDLAEFAKHGKARRTAPKT